LADCGNLRSRPSWVATAALLGGRFAEPTMLAGTAARPAREAAASATGC
jgi:hypothetical protein